MPAAAKCNMVVRPTVDHEPIGLAELTRITVCCGHDEVDLVAGPDAPAGEVHVLRRNPGQMMDGPDQSKELLDRGTGERWIAMQVGHGFGIVEEGAEAEVWEQYLSGADDLDGVFNTVTELVVGDNARLRYVCGQDLSEHSWIFGA